MVAILSLGPTLASVSNLKSESIGVRFEGEERLGLEAWSVVNRIVSIKEMNTTNLAFWLFVVSLSSNLLSMPVTGFAFDFVGKMVQTPRMPMTMIRRIRSNSQHPNDMKNARSRKSILRVEPPMSSYDVDTDEEAEQRLGENSMGDPHTSVAAATSSATNGGVNGGSSTMNHGGGGGRFDSLLSSVGLEGKLKHISDLPSERTISTYDIFCNRELRMSAVRAIGFDMDYTLCQYQQPAFDKLAFDGAKEKLVYKLGYPKEVLDFEYDHEVRMKRGKRLERLLVQFH
jgi:5' nucleotidase family